ncbi:TIGR01777 family oxidoreductase [Acidiferrimicrobium sp. IK]|uniref:TIGR01777 family oxidoreductase n=1 Tax=Acidiferrimicrobium sp. IK TaxID=2871700 RepID=UPI0021CB294B|nr:TIGR01777 family oxidoreductase [Acidiferrimicrobium sp. IK]MCU4183815.1 TIGR01777 family oxidoreductase [Acidiferrimicrobium sp. IK]
MRIAVTGSHGLIAGHLIPALRGAGHDVTALVRGPAAPGEVHWDPERGELDPGDLAGVDGVVHLAGAGLLRRWTDGGKQQIVDSRVKGTTLLAEVLAGLDPQPKVLVSASAIGWYGDRGDEVLSEDSTPGTGFLAEVAQRWEASTAPAIDAGIRTVFLRTGIVQSTDGGALKAQKPVFALGLGGRLGSGRQWVSWISLDDEVGAILHALGDERLSGPVNLTAPNPVTNAGYTKALGRALHRPAVMVVPGPVISAVMGSEMAHQMLLGGQRVLPGRLEASGYRFAHRTIDEALADLLKR